MFFDYRCQKCREIVTVEKSIKDDHPTICPLCHRKGLERHFAPDCVPYIHYANRPIWTYKDCKRYKNMRMNGGPLMKVDPSKHGDLGSWNANAELDSNSETRKQKHAKLLRETGSK